MAEHTAEDKARREKARTGLLTWGRIAALASVLVAGGPAWAQFAHVPMPLVAGAPRTSDAQTDQAYRRDAALRIYESFPMHIYRGKLPALTYAIAITETDVRADGQVLDVRLVREPASAKEVGNAPVLRPEGLTGCAAPRSRPRASQPGTGVGAKAPQPNPHWL